MATSLIVRLSSCSADRSKSVTAPRPSQRGHMPPRRKNVAFLVWVLPPRSTVMPPLARTEGTLNEYALGEPMCGCPGRLKGIRSIGLASVAVPTVERGSAPIRSWSTRIAVVSPSRTSTSGRASVGMKPCTKALYVSLIIRWDSAAIVPNTSELLPEPETPVNTVSRRFGISMLTSLRLFTRAPCTRMRSWLSATCSGDCVSMRSISMTVKLDDLGGRRFSIPDRSGHLLDDARRHPHGGACRVAPGGARRHAEELGEARAEGAQRRAADLEADLGDAEVAATQQRHRALDPSRHEIGVGRLAVREPERAAE